MYHPRRVVVVSTPPPVYLGTTAYVTTPVTYVAPPAVTYVSAVTPTYVAVATPSYVQTAPIQVHPPPQQRPQTVTLSGPPLPAGYQACIDPASQKVFFVNHNNHTTTWDDPRFPQQQYQPQQQQYQPQQQQYQQPQQQQQQPQQPRADSSYQYGHRFCNSCGIEVTREATVCICGKPLRN